jgi:hypothetical protein
MLGTPELPAFQPMMILLLGEVVNVGYFHAPFDSMQAILGTGDLAGCPIFTPGLRLALILDVD